MRLRNLLMFAAIILIGTTGFGTTVHDASSAQGVTCASFASQPEAQSYFDANGGPPELDADGNGIACESITQEPPVVEPVATATSTLAPLPTDTPTFVPTATATTTPTIPVTGTDRISCEEYERRGYTYQQFYDEIFRPTGGPNDDPGRYDGDGDGIPCEDLPGHPPGASTAPQNIYGRNGVAGTGTATPTSTATSTATPRANTAPGRAGSPTAAPPNVRSNPAPTATSRPRRTTAAAPTNRNDPDYVLGQIDAWLALERDAGETLRTGMADPDFTDPAWYVEQSSAVGIILAVQANIQDLDVPRSLDDVATIVQAASDVQAAAAATCDAALVSNDLDDATQCLDAIDVATEDIADLRDALQTWDGETLDFRPST